jgi:FIMAH domain-containing protein
MKLLLIVLLAGVLSVLGSVTATAQEMCPMTPTVPALRDCVTHASNEGLIDNAGVTHSLFARLDAAQAAVNRGQPEVAANILTAFVQEVQAQAGQHIDATHAAHMVLHAQAVIAALQAP